MECTNCKFVFDDKLKKCPKCGHDFSVDKKDNLNAAKIALGVETAAIAGGLFTSGVKASETSGSEVSAEQHINAEAMNSDNYDSYEVGVLESNQPNTDTMTTSNYVTGTTTDSLEIENGVIQGTNSSSVTGGVMQQVDSSGVTGGVMQRVNSDTSTAYSDLLDAVDSTNAEVYDTPVNNSGETININFKNTNLDDTVADIDFTNMYDNLTDEEAVELLNALGLNSDGLTIGNDTTQKKLHVNNY